MPLTGTAVEQRLLKLVRRAVEMRSDTELLALVRDDRVRRTHRPAWADGVGLVARLTKRAVVPAFVAALSTVSVADADELAGLTE